MTEVFTKNTSKWDYTAIVPEILRGTQLPLPVKTARNSLKPDALFAFYAKPRDNATYWAEKTSGFDFSRADQLDAPAYNLILWDGLRVDNTPYPSTRSGADLRKNRKALLKQWRASQLAAFSKPSSSTSTSKSK
jgi:hypothetical protein